MRRYVYFCLSSRQTRGETTQVVRGSLGTAFAKRGITSIGGWGAVSVQVDDELGNFDAVVTVDSGQPSMGSAPAPDGPIRTSRTDGVVSRREFFYLVQPWNFDWLALGTTV